MQISTKSHRPAQASFITTLKGRHPATLAEVPDLVNSYQALHCAWHWSGSCSDAPCQGPKPAPRQPAQLQDSQLLSQIFIPTQGLPWLGLSCPLGQETPGTLIELPGAWLALGQQASGWSLKRQPRAPRPGSTTTSPQPHTKKPHIGQWH